MSKGKTQTRRTIGVSSATYYRIMAYAAEHDTSASQVVEQAIAPVIDGDTASDREGCKACEVMQRIRGYPCIRHYEPEDRAERAKAIGVVR